MGTSGLLWEPRARKRVADVLNLVPTTFLLAQKCLLGRLLGTRHPSPAHWLYCTFIGRICDFVGAKRLPHSALHAKLASEPCPQPDPSHKLIVHQSHTGRPQSRRSVDPAEEAVPARADCLRDFHASSQCVAHKAINGHWQPARTRLRLHVTTEGLRRRRQKGSHSPGRDRRRKLKHSDGVRSVPVGPVGTHRDREACQT